MSFLSVNLHSAALPWRSEERNNFNSLLIDISISNINKEERKERFTTFLRKCHQL